MEVTNNVVSQRWKHRRKRPTSICIRLVAAYRGDPKQMLWIDESADSMGKES